MPETIGTIIVTAVASATVASTPVVGTITVAAVVGTTVLVGGSIALQFALQQKPPGADAERGQITTRQPLTGRRRAYGRVKLGLVLVFSETVDGRRWQVGALHHGEIDAFEQHWLSEFQVFLSLGDNGTVLNKYLISTTPHVLVETRTGTDSQTAFASLVSEFPTLWTSNHRGRGIACVMTYTLQPVRELFTEVFPGGLPPPYRAVIRASKVWDPREGGQDKDNPATWTWSDNPVLIALDYHRHADGMGLAGFDDTFFTSAAITEDWIPAANICDETVGGEPRYRCSGSYELPNDTPAAVLAAILATCDGRPYQRGDGAIGIRVGKAIAPTVALDDTHIRGYDGFKKGDNVFLACNEVTAKYVSPDHDYQETDAEAWRDEADISARGQVLTKPLPLQWVPSHSQARRLMKLAMYRFNPEWQGRIVTDMAGLAAFNERYIEVSIAELGIEEQAFEVTSFDIILGTEGITCAIGVSSLDEEAFAWDPETEAGEAPPVPPGVQGS